MKSSKPTPHLFVAVACVLVAFGLGQWPHAMANPGAGQAGQGIGWWSRSIWENPERGTVWYPPERLEAPEVKPEDAPKNKEAQRAPEIDEFERIQKRLGELRQIAIITPTQENIRAYIEFQEAQMQRASVFADQWRRTLWANPELAYDGRPVNATGINSFDAAYGQRVKGSLNQLANTHGLYFFFRSDCPYCHAMAPTLELLQRTHGIRIIAISMDGGSLPQFPNALPNRGQAEQLGVRSVPSYFIAEPSKRSVLPLGSGVMSLSALEDRIYTQAFTQAGSKF